MKLSEVIRVGKQNDEFMIGRKQEFEKMKSKKIAHWRNLSLMEGSAHRFKVIDHRETLVYGFMCKPFQNGLSIIWAENYSDGQYKNLTKEIIFELVKSGIDEIYTDNKQTDEMIIAHKKILSELPYEQVVVEKYDQETDTFSTNFDDIFNNRNTFFRFTWNNKHKKISFEDEMNESSWRVHQECILKKLINSDKLYEWDEFFDLKNEVLSYIPKDEIEEAYLESGIYDNVADFTYEYNSWVCRDADR